MIRHVAEYGEVADRAVRNLLDVGLRRARGLLEDWVRRGLLAEMSAHERGAVVRLGPGPEVPPRSGWRGKAARGRAELVVLEGRVSLPGPAAVTLAVLAAITLAGLAAITLPELEAIILPRR
jgi:hypothetical protein